VFSLDGVVKVGIEEVDTKINRKCPGLYGSFYEQLLPS